MLVTSAQLVSQSPEHGRLMMFEISSSVVISDRFIFIQVLISTELSQKLRYALLEVI